MAADSLRVLLAENRLSETGIILRSLCAGAGWALELIFVGTRVELAQALPAHCPEVALVDLSLLQPDAAVHLRVLHQANPAIPLILFADPVDKACAVKCLSMGAKDFLLEGFMDERTMARVLRSAVDPGPAGGLTPSLVDLISARGRNLHRLPGERPLPGSSVTASHLCAFWVCLENLEQAQLQVGDQLVDRLWQELAQMLRKRVRAGDEVVPVSRGQMVISLHNADESCSAAILQRIRARVKEYKPSFLPSLSPVVAVHAERNAFVSEELRTNLPPSELATPDCAAQSTGAY